ncbi:MAG: peptidylprolyl isomerase [Sporichthyaceae bacterium]
MTRTLRTAGLALGMALLVTGCGDDDTSPVQTAPEAETSRAPTSEPTSEPSAGASAAAGSGTASGGKASCDYIDSPSNVDVKREVEKPSASAGTKTRYATFETSLGKIVIELDAAAAPCTVNSFASLITQKYYDGSFCHRVLDDGSGATRTAVVQCGDPSGTGRGGPGYRFADENLDGASYDEGVIAMANAGPNTNGSQFFMMFDKSAFSPDYSPFGKLLSGLDVLKKVADGGLTGPMGDSPKTKLTIEKATVSDTKPTTS